MGNGNSESVVWQGMEHKLLPVMFYHLAHPDSHIFWNVFLHKGFLISESMAAQADDLQWATTPYALTRQDDPKERVWEEVRVSEYPHNPSRMKALFLFDDRDMSLQAKDTWFPGEERNLLAVRVLQGSQVHKGDSKWLNSYEHEWKANARKYWAGELTADPAPEVILHGVAYFPDWEEPPFGSIAGKSINPRAKEVDSRP